MYKYDYLTNKKSRKNPYMAEKAQIISIEEEAPNIMSFKLKCKENSKLYDFIPGQFAIWSLLGVGEAPFSYSSSPINKEFIQFTIHKTGRVTNAIFKFNIGDFVSIRGPYGNGFPMDKMLGKNLIFVMGGIGAAPLRSVLNYVLTQKSIDRSNFGNIFILHGARTPELMLFRNEFELHVSNPEIDCFMTIDTLQNNSSWSHNVGVVTTLFEKIDFGKIEIDKTVVLICGPPVMYKFVIGKLDDLGIPQNQIYMTMERRMKCGIGFCGHCAIDYVYTCMDGPVFTYWDAKYLEELI